MYADSKYIEAVRTCRSRATAGRRVIAAPSAILPKPRHRSAVVDVRIRAPMEVMAILRKYNEFSGQFDIALWSRLAGFGVSLS